MKEYEKVQNKMTQQIQEVKQSIREKEKLLEQKKTSVQAALNRQGTSPSRSPAKQETDQQIRKQKSSLTEDKNHGIVKRTADKPIKFEPQPIKNEVRT